jgi:hypothetical protein
MAESHSMTIEQVVREVMADEHADVLRESVRLVVQELMNAEVSELIGAEPGERTPDRATWRNGYRSREWDTRLGVIELGIPKLRQGSYFPHGVLEPRKRGEHPSWRSSSRPMCAASRTAASTNRSRSAHGADRVPLRPPSRGPFKRASCAHGLRRSLLHRNRRPAHAIFGQEAASRWGRAAETLHRKRQARRALVSSSYAALRPIAASAS